MTTSTTNLKAVRITKDNRSTLESKYQMAEDTLELDSGMYLIAEFGAAQSRGVITKRTLEDRYARGAALRNDFFAITNKTLVSP